MAGQVSVKTFKGGMNKDIDVSLLQEDQYRHAENFKLIADEDSNGFILENSEGNDIWFDFSEDCGLDEKLFNPYYYHLVGHCFIKPYLVVFYTTINFDTEPDDSPGDTLILRLLLDGDKIVEVVNIFQELTSAHGSLSLSTTYPLNTVGYYEAPDNIKVYWTDGYNPTRAINIMDEDLSDYSAGMFDLTPDFPISTSVNPRPQIDSLVTGNLPVCSVQYAYQYFIDRGNETLFSPASVIQVIPVNAQTSNFSRTIGGDTGEDTTYGVKFTIAVPSENLYNRIRIVALQYNSYNAIPQVRIIEELYITPSASTTLTIVDTGQLISEMTYEEFAVVNSSIYRARDLAIKDNRLFLGNINEELFDVDFDARAYRFNTSSTARVYKSNLTNYYTIWNNGYWTYNAGGGGTDWSVPEDADAINRFNNPDDELSHVTYQYQDDGTTIGATGKNIEISVVTNDGTLLDTLGDSNNTYISSLNSTLYTAGENSFQRQEVYRIGIIFRNEKMQPSPVKWVCDFKMPMHSDDADYKITEIDGDTCYAVRMGLSVTLNNFPLSEGAKTWEVVYVPRGSDDRGVLAQGIIQPSYYNIISSFYQSTHYMRPETTIANEYYNPICMFLSPEISYNRNLEYRTGDYFQKTGHYYFHSVNNYTSTPAINWQYWKLNSFSADGTYATGYKQTIIGASILPYDTNEDSKYTVGVSSVSSYFGTGADSNIGPGGVKLAASTSSWDTAFIDWSAGSSSTVIAANYKRNVFSYQYGGPDNNDRQLNIYIGASDPKMADGTVETYEGDTVIDFFWHNHRYIDIPKAEAGDTDTVGATFLFPVETSIKMRLNHSPFLYRAVSFPPNNLGQDISGTWTGEIPLGSGDSFTYTQDESMYVYNTIFSQPSNANLFVADSDSFNTNSKYPTRIIVSDQKTNNETLDSFTLFKVNNFIDLDGNKGQIQNLKVFKNDLYYWQDTGFGIASVNKRSLIQDNNPGTLALGTGGILDRYDYISDTVGNQNQYGIVISRKNMYWVDNNKNEFFKYSGGVDTISKIKGIQTWLNEKGRIGTVNAVFDEKYNNIIFTINFAKLATVLTIDGDGLITTFSVDVTATEDDVTCRITDSNTTYSSDRNVSTWAGPYIYDFSSGPHGDVGREFWITYDHNTSNRYTLTFNEVVDKFVSFNSFTPMRYIKTDSAYYSSNDNWDIYIHNDNDVTRCTYYGIKSESVITVQFNSEFPYTKTWDAMKWVSESVDSDDISQYADTFQTLEIYNDYQTTGERTLVVNTTPAVGETELTRRERTWSMFIPRNIVDVNVSDNPDIHDVSNHDETQLFKERMRDKFLTCKFTYDNGDGNVFSVPFISTVYRKSVR